MLESDASNKIFEIVDILQELCDYLKSIRRHKNHSIHDYKDFILFMALRGNITEPELTYLIIEAKEIKEYFKRSKDIWIKDRTSNVADFMQKLIDDIKIPNVICPNL